MFCLYPMIARYTGAVNPKTGKRSVSVIGKAYDGDSHNMNVSGSHVELDGDTFLIPCGRCISCRLKRAKEWAVRCMLEAHMHDEAMFLTLTYNDDNVPLIDGKATLCKKDFQDFMKRYRKMFSDTKIRFYMCGEYGSKFERPHYHAIIFGHQFLDLEVFRADQNLYRSKSLEKLWTKGFSTVGSVTMDSCMYVARYVLKKMTGASAEEHYDSRVPEYTNMSLKPGIGADFFEKYHESIYAIDQIVISDAIKCRTPRYFDKLYSVDHDVNELNICRFEKARKFVDTFVDMETGEIRLNQLVDSTRNEALREFYSIREKNKERYYETGNVKPVKIYKKML